MTMGVKDRMIVWTKKIHFPFVEVGLKEHIPLVIMCVPLVLEPDIVADVTNSNYINDDKIINFIIRNLEYIKHEIYYLIKSIKHMMCL